MMEHLPKEPVNGTGSFLYLQGKISLKTSMIFYSQIKWQFLP